LSTGPSRNGTLTARRPAAASRAPAFRDGFVRRPALVGRLREARDAPLALVVAPAGYGKSTLLAEWAACDERPFIWITLDSFARDTAAVAASISAALEELGWIERARQDFVLVLDDAHSVPADVLRAIVAALLGRVGPGSQIAVASRTEPKLPIGRLRAHRQLVEVRADDLTMAPAEASSLLRMAGLELELGAVQTLSAQTEGWPVGLYLASLALRRRRDDDDCAMSFDLDDDVIAEYVRDEFLADLPPEVMSFLMRTSVLEDLSGPLCDAVLQQHDSGATLSRLAGCNLMLVALDQRHQRFRWHGLFGAMLRAELRRAEPELEPELHRRASGWLARHGDLDGAIGHAVAAGEIARAGELLWGNVARYLGGGRIEPVQRWLSSFSPEQIAGCAPLALAAAHTALMTGSVAEARQWGLLAAEADRRTGGAHETPSLEAGVAIIDAAAARTGTAQMARDATRAYDLEPEHSPWRPICCLLRGVAAHLAGDRPGAETALGEGVQLTATGTPGIVSLCLGQLALIAIEQDDWESAGEFAARASRIVEAHASLGAYPIAALVFAASAATAAHQGRNDEAKRDLRHGIDLLAALGDFVTWYGAQTRILLARAAIGLADTVRARTLLAEASRLARRTPDAVIFEHCFDQAWAQIDTLAETALSGPSSLTIAELRILRFLPSHRSFREIAERLDVSVNTVKTQAHAIYRKLDAASRSEAVARASSAGLLGT
jgi:LuxR family maltose regulon positive regulatory protein